MDIYKLKFTRLQNEILRFLFIKSGKLFNLRRIALSLRVSLTAVSKALKDLEKENLITVTKDPDSKQLSITLDRENEKVIFLKRLENLRLLYESGFIDYLYDAFPGSTIILFGSYSFGEDIYDSDIDLAIIGKKEKELDSTKFEKILEREIILNFYDDFENIHKNLRLNIANGITLKGAL